MKKLGFGTVCFGTAIMMAACGGGGGSSGKDGGADAGPIEVTEWATIPTAAYPNGGNIYTGSRELVAGDPKQPGPKPANMTCLNVADTTAGAAFDSVTFNGVVKDFQNPDTQILANGELAVWTDVTKLGMPPDVMTTTDSTGKFMVTVPGVMGKKRLHWRTQKTGEVFPTYVLNDQFDVTMATQMKERNSVSLFTGQALPALAGIRRKDGTGVIAGVARDCDHVELGNTIATVLGPNGQPIPGVTVVYMSDQDLPRRRDTTILHSLASNAHNGIFIIIDVPPTASVTMAVEGNIGGVRKRLSTFAAPVFADSVVVVDADPDRTP